MHSLEDHLLVTEGGLSGEFLLFALLLRLDLNVPALCTVRESLLLATKVLLRIWVAVILTGTFKSPQNVQGGIQNKVTKARIPLQRISQQYFNIHDTRSLEGGSEASCGF